MRTIATAVLLVLATGRLCLAQERPALPERSDVFLAETGMTRSSPVLDRKFWAVAAVLNTAMVFDTKSTFDVAGACANCRERNPLVAPFVRRGAAVTLTAGEVFDAGIMTLAAKMKGAKRTWVRRTWWVVPAALVAGHSVAYRHNVTLLR